MSGKFACRVDCMIRRTQEYIYLPEKFSGSLASSDESCAAEVI
jgi:hypothetical protein